MTSLIDNYLREVSASLRVDAARKGQIVDELRTHLVEKVLDLQSDNPSRPAHEIEQEVLREFGNPRDLALAYEPEGAAVLRNSAGDIVLRLGHAARAVGRSTGRVLKWTAITLGVLLVVSLGVGAWAYYEVKPYIPAIIEGTSPAYDYSESCPETPCSGSPTPDQFYIHADARTVRLDVNVFTVHPRDSDRVHVGNGSVSVTVRDPDGVVRMERTFNLTNDGRLAYQTSWNSQEGNWSIAYAFEGFRGAIHVQTYAIAIPWASDH